MNPAAIVAGYHGHHHREAVLSLAFADEAAKLGYGAAVVMHREAAQKHRFIAALFADCMPQPGLGQP